MRVELRGGCFYVSVFLYAVGSFKSEEMLLERCYFNGYCLSSNLSGMKTYHFSKIAIAPSVGRVHTYDKNPNYEVFQCSK